MLLTFGSLFAGIGGFDLGFERAGMKCFWQVEIDDYANKVLEKHWPDVRRWRDVRTFPPEPRDEWRVDVICGGFPCQDVSIAGLKAGLAGARSGLWSEFIRVVCTLHPGFVVIENVDRLIRDGLETVLRDLAESGYDAEWSLISACSMGAPHARKRLFVVAYPAVERRASTGIFEMANACETMAQASWWKSSGAIRTSTTWATEPELDGVADGIPSRLDRVACLGNAVVPQVAEWIGRRIVEAVDKSTKSAK